LLDADVSVMREAAKRIVDRAKSVVVPAPKFSVDDLVRIALPKSKVGSRIEKWTNKIFKIKRIIKPTNPWEQEQYQLDNNRIYTEIARIS